MDEPPETSLRREGLGKQAREALSCIEKAILDGLQHGHFRYTISSTVGKGNRRELVIEAGKCFKYTIPADEVTV